MDEHALAFPSGQGLEMAAIGRNELKLLLVEAVPRQACVAVRKRDLLPFGIVKLRSGEARLGLAAEEPAAVQFVSAARSVGCGRRGFRSGLRAQPGSGGRPQQESAAVQWMVSHKVPL